MQLSDSLDIKVGLFKIRTEILNNRYIYIKLHTQFKYILSVYLVLYEVFFCFSFHRCPYFTFYLAVSICTVGMSISAMNDNLLRHMHVHVHIACFISTPKMYFTISRNSVFAKFIIFDYDTLPPTTSFSNYNFRVNLQNTKQTTEKQTVEPSTAFMTDVL